MFRRDSLGHGTVTTKLNLQGVYFVLSLHAQVSRETLFIMTEIDPEEEAGPPRSCNLGKPISQGL